MDRWLAAEKEAALPEFRRQRPKYYYYYEWMRERIAQRCGALPQPVLDKLLNIDAGELDDLLTYPDGIRAKVGHCLAHACLEKPARHLHAFPAARQHVLGGQRDKLGAWLFCCMLVALAMS